MEIMIDNREDNRRIASAVKYYTHAEYDKNAHEYHGYLFPADLLESISGIDSGT